MTTSHWRSRAILGPCALAPVSRGPQDLGVIVLLAWLLTVSFSAFSCAQDTPVSAMMLSAITDRPEAIYKVGEQATFAITATVDLQPAADQEIDVVLSEDGFKPSAPQKVKLVDGRAQVTGTLNKPGFLMLKVMSGKSSALAAVGFDPQDIKPSMPAPDDFDPFWAEQKAALAKVPVKSQMNEVESPVKNVKAYDVQVDCLGAPVSGYFGEPIDAMPKSLPAILFVHGAGVGSSNLSSVHWATQGKGMLTMDINAHGLPNGEKKEYYDEIARSDLKDYRTRGRNAREEVYFRGMFLRLIRAIDFLTSRPAWDGKKLIVYGSSQGGFQALAAAGLDERVTFICAGVPAGCDHTGSQAERISGWPKLVATDERGQPVPESLQAARYYEAVNFAQRAKCQGAAVTVGFIDTTCPPTSVYAAYNALGMPKSIHIDVLAGHTNTPAASKFMQAAALKHCQE